MKKHWIVIVIAALIAVYQGWHRPDERRSLPQDASHEVRKHSSLQQAIATHASHVQVEGSGEVVKVLADDRDGSPHQRFLVRVGSGEVILIAHNIDLAPRVDALRAGDAIDFAGEYIWNEKGGVLHWTHHDPSGRHRSGWLRHAGRTYQ